MKKAFIIKTLCLILTVCIMLPMLASCELDDILERESQSERDTMLSEEDTTDGEGVSTAGDNETTVGDGNETTAGDDETTVGDGNETTAGDDETTVGDGNETTAGDEETTAGDSETTDEDKTTEKEDITTEYSPAIDGLDIDSNKLHGNMQNVFAGDTVFYETVMFLDKGETKRLLFPIDEIVSLQDYNGKTTYVEGRDYQIVNGMLYIPSTSTINKIITSKKYYNYTANPMIYEKYNGTNVSVYWGEGGTMTQWQLRITYKHSKTWSGFKQESYAETYEGLIRKLMAGEDVTFIFYGDSITCGANSSWYTDTPTRDWYDTSLAFYQWSYSMLFTQALADLFGYKINFVDVKKQISSAMIKTVPDDYISSGYVEGVGGTITYINTSIGGWTSADGVNNFNKHVGYYIENYGCDLLGVAFGMNDGGTDATVTANNIKSIYQKAMALDSDFYGMVISTMLPNNKSTNGWYGNQYKQEAKLEDVVSYLNSNGIKSGLARMTSVSQALLTRKDFRDYTGNNINHPNDFMQRIYAQTCLQAFIGYENMR